MSVHRKPIITAGEAGCDRGVDHLASDFAFRHHPWCQVECVFHKNSTDFLRIQTRLQIRVTPNDESVLAIDASSWGPQSRRLSRVSLTLLTGAKLETKRSLPHRCQSATRTANYDVRKSTHPKTISITRERVSTCNRNTPTPRVQNHAG